MKINLNSASFEKIHSCLRMLGEYRAHEIIYNRPYRDWDDLKKKVPRISDGMVQDIMRSGGIIQ